MVSNKVVNLFTGALVGLALSLPFTDLLEPVPYNNVVVEEFYRDGDYLNTTISFTKRGCVFQYLQVFGETLSTWERLVWTDVEGRQGDRAAGDHTIRLVVALGGNTHSRIQIVTRHECDGEVVDRVLLERDLADEIR